MTQSSGEPLSVCLISHLRYSLKEPFAGGLESATLDLARGLIRAGHRVTLFAASGSTAPPGVRLLTPQRPMSVAGREGQIDPVWTALAYRDLMDRIRDRDFDVIHNHSLHAEPLLRAKDVRSPMVTTFHTPPFCELSAAVESASREVAYTAVSRRTAQQWRSQCKVQVSEVRNGVDTRVFDAGPGGGPAVWSGRIVPEKAPHEAIDAARSVSMPLQLVGPIMDPDYFDLAILPRLGDGAEYVGHLDHRDLASLLGHASVCLVTPVWEEPFGLVAAEAAACGTPVAAYARGGLVEVVTPEVGVLSRPGDPDQLGQALREAAALDRGLVRAHAQKTFDLDHVIADYEVIYRSLIGERASVA